MQRCRLQNSLPHWRCIRLYLPQRRIARLIRAAIAAQPPLKGKAYEKPDGKGNGAAAQETEKNRRAEHGRSKSNAGGEKPAGTDLTVVEVGELLGISKYECVMRWLRENNVPSYRVNGRRKYAEVDVARVLYLAREA